MKAPKYGGPKSISLCGRRCTNMYLYEAVVHPRVEGSLVEYHFRCATCGAEYIGTMDEQFITHYCVQRQGMANNVHPPSCPL
jgi:hypothetical protein